MGVTGNLCFFNGCYWKFMEFFMDVTGNLCFFSWMLLEMYANLWICCMDVTGIFWKFMSFLMDVTGLLWIFI
jgi:hypothetical protein